MRRQWFLIMVAAVILIGSGSVAPAFSAAAKETNPEERVANQQKRIDQALQAKEITPEDVKTLQAGLDKIKEEMTRMKADGQLSKEEKDKLNNMLDQNGQLINKTRQAKKAPAADPAKAAAAAPPAKSTGPAAEKMAKPAPAAPVGTAPAAAPVKPGGAPAPTPPKAVATPAPAPPKVVTPAPQDPSIQQAIADQQKGIDQGIRSKQLTLEESKTLEQNLSSIRQLDAELRSDGTFTQADKDQVLKLLDQNSKMTKDKKNNPVKNMRESISLKDRQYSIPERLVRQQRRIDEGVKSKELTAEEAKVLQDNLAYIKTEHARLTASGKLTDQEKNRLHTLFDQNSDMIHNKKHNPVKKVQ